MKTFSYDGKNQKISFVESLHVTEGVVCDVYTFDGDTSKDLGIIKISPGSSTPLQKVLKGKNTIEGYIRGNGQLEITQPDGKKKTYSVSGETKLPFSIEVKIGELMQWHAEENSKLVAYEICIPPYEDGRYENVT